ncbi:hypothetical protein H257_07426 [Aphanomyces astaci]|uniref:EF-hand domain-containing protein n=1 Tax=Aphanomyces astaci TaxID=112090 RepID=W4GK44_APHAT|nr:hypothetical protein H257_07426 [Aphanomyces astaci]ETV79409.1 hypothetical protein H257_07426 [Aphanomyces astaci]|eukprot:XP_009831250.1 hypothetical protein H257_07426 [Aphanomyces astaci]
MGHRASKEVECDLSLERLEEIRMLTQLPIPDIIKMRVQFLKWSPSDDMTQDQFFAIPAVAVNPLRHRLFSLFELSASQTIAFQDFASLMAIFTYHGSRDSKLRLSFKLQDMDGDGRITKPDLIAYMKLVVDFGDKLDVLASRTLEEASTDASGDFLSYDDFAKVVTTTDDYETKLLLELS